MLLTQPPLSLLHLFSTRCELCASSQVLRHRHGRLRMDCSGRRLESLVSDSHPALCGQGHETPAWRTEIFGGLKQGKPAISSTWEQWGADRLTKHLNHFLGSKKERECTFWQKGQDLSRASAGASSSPAGWSCQPRCGAVKSLQGTTYIPQWTENLSLSPFPSWCECASSNETPKDQLPVYSTLPKGNPVHNLWVWNRKWVNKVIFWTIYVTRSFAKL